MGHDSPQLLAAVRRCAVVLPAGCGKTEILVRLVEGAVGRQLILTHTHAGRRTIRQRMARNGVPTTKARVDTIASWALEYARAHRDISRYDPGPPERLPNFDAVCRAVARIVSRPLGARILRASYAGIAVDEYQDCSRSQHDLVLALAEVLPCRIVGDPMQSIFHFGDNDPVPWPSVEKAFPPVNVEPEPHRWVETNPELGRWLLAVRADLEAGREVRFDARVPGLRWHNVDEHSVRVRMARAAMREAGEKETVLLLGRLPTVCHHLARSIGVGFVAPDEQERRELNAWAEEMTESDAEKRVACLVALAKKCLTGITDSLGRVATKGLPRITSATDATVRVLHEVSLDGSPRAVLAAYAALGKAGRHPFRRQLWREAGYALRDWTEEPTRTIAAAARRITHEGKFRHNATSGRMTVSRTLLVKGLEFDHVIVTDANQLDAENLYVAMTRARRRLTIMSASPAVQPERAALQPRSRQGSLAF